MPMPEKNWRCAYGSYRHTMATESRSMR